MKLKGGFRYFARLNNNELQIIKSALELLLEEYEKPPSINWWSYDQRAVSDLLIQINRAEDNINAPV